MIQPGSMVPNGCLWGPDRGGVRAGGAREAHKPTCATLLSPISIYQLLRKRHIGNDIVTIIFQEPGALPFTPKNIRSHFQHVFIIVRVHNPCTDNVCYRYAPLQRLPPTLHSQEVAATDLQPLGSPLAGASATMCASRELCPHVPALLESHPQAERSMASQFSSVIRICLESFGRK